MKIVTILNLTLGNYFQFSSVTQSCPTLGDPRGHSTPGFPVLHHLLQFLTSVESVMPSNHLTLCRPLLLLPSVFPSLRVFSNELALLVRWEKYWSFSISPSNEYSGLIFLRIDWFNSTSVTSHKYRFCFCDGSN